MTEPVERCPTCDLLRPSRLVQNGFPCPLCETHASNIGLRKFTLQGFEGRIEAVAHKHRLGLKQDVVTIRGKKFLIKHGHTAGAGLTS